MSRARVLQTLVGLVVIAAAVVVYFVWIPVQGPDPGRLRALVVTHPVGGVVGTGRVTYPAASASPLAAVRTAASATSGETGLASVTWKGKGTVTHGGLVAAALPAALDAEAALVQSDSQDLGKTSLTSLGYGYGGTLALRGAPGVQAAYFLAGTSPKTTAKTPRIAVAVFRSGRVVVVATAYSKGDAADRVLASLVTAESRRLSAVGTTQPIAQTSVPLIATLVYAVVVAALLAASASAPSVWAAYARRQRAAHEAAVRRERSARGKKVVTRRASHGYAARHGSRRVRSRR